MTHDPGGKVKLPVPVHWKRSAEWRGEHEQYRPLLSYWWDATRPMLLGALMNPSVATTEILDPTLAKVGRIALRWRFGGFFIINACDIRVTDSRLLPRIKNPCSEYNEDAWRRAAARAAEIIVGYGKLHPSLSIHAERMTDVLRESTGKTLYALGINRDGSPKHPLYCQENDRPRVWRPAPA